MQAPPDPQNFRLRSEEGLDEAGIEVVAGAFPDDFQGFLHRQGCRPACTIPV
jgi:hypothetical protein